MQKGLSLQALAAKIEANRELKHDLIAPTNQLRMAADEDKRTKLIVDTNSFPILQVAHDQIAAHARIPRDYYNRMRGEAPELLANNVNEWFSRFDNKDRRMVRTLGGDHRALLSNKYQRIENDEIAEAALPVLADLPGVEIVSSEVTERRLYIHFTVPTIAGEVKRGDVVQAGGIISNSEIGFGSASVSEMIWRLVCLNGMKTGEAYRRHHVGRRVEDSAELWAQDTIKADDRAVLLKVRDMVRAVVDRTRFNATLAKLGDLTEGKISGDPAKAVEVLARKVGATQAEQGGILRSLIQGGDLSRWGIINAITHQAHEATSYDRAVEFEAMGGDLVNLGRDEWKEVLEAA